MRKAKRKKRWRASKKFVGLAVENFCVALASVPGFLLSNFFILCVKKN
jgi:hypothetical protein